MKYQIKVKIKDLSEKYGKSLRKLAEESGIRHATLSELSNGKRKNINFGHIERIAKALNITDIREIIDLEITEEKEDEE